MFISINVMKTVAEVNSTLYWRHTFSSICDPKQLIEYTVMDIEPVKFKDRKFFPGQGTISNKVSFINNSGISFSLFKCDKYIKK